MDSNKGKAIEKITLATIAAFQNDLRSRLSNHADLFKGHLENNDTDAHWNLWNHDIEAAFGSTFKLTGIPLKRHTGRGQPDIRQTYAAKPTTHADELYEDPNDRRIGTLEVAQPVHSMGFQDSCVGQNGGWNP